MDEFVHFLMDAHINFRNPTTIDGIKGEFIFDFHKKYMCFEWKDIHYPNCKRRHYEYTWNEAHLKESLLRILSLQFWKGDPILNDKELTLKRLFRNMQQEFYDTPPRMCCKCSGDCREFVLNCGHSMCYPCSVGSIRYESRDGDDGIYVLDCPICHQKWIQPDCDL